GLVALAGGQASAQDAPAKSRSALAETAIAACVPSFTSPSADGTGVAATISTDPPVVTAPNQDAPTATALPVTAAAPAAQAGQPPAGQTQAPAGQAGQPAPIQQVPVVAGPVIDDIVVVGNKVLNSAAIITLSGHKKGDPCSSETLTDMRDRLAKTGNFGMHHPDQQERWVQVQAEDIGNNKCKVTITVDENDAINSIAPTGTGPIKGDDVKALITKTAVYNVEQIAQDAQNIIELYNKRGYSIEFGQDLGMDPNNPGVLLLPILVTRVDDIVISKKHKTRDYVILRELKTKKGDYFNRKTFYEKDRAKLINLDLFDDVTFSEATVGTGTGRVKLTINVVEKRTGSISAGVGYSNRQQLIGRAEVSETNFQGRGEGVSLLWETGGVASRNSVELTYTRPWLDKHQTSLQVNLFDKTVYRFSNSLQSADNSLLSTNAGHYNEQRRGGAITVSRPLRDTLRLALTGRVENVHTDPLSLSGVNAEIVQDGPIESVGASLLRDTRDLILDPVAGGYQSLSIQAGHATLNSITNANGFPVSQAVTGSVNFSKGQFEWRQYFSLQGRRKHLTDEKSAIAVRFLAGGAAGTLPFFEQFFVGGAESLRGYREDRFWGKYMFLGSIELRQPLARRLKGVVFADVGDAWGGPYSNVSLQGFQQTGFQPRASVGLGIRVGTPLGPIRLDYGIGSEGGRAHFSIGNVF
ncbi:MAG TPA: BamA/TamA family outer membrane protein, partial [Chthonomonadaceae bacterium]|nr:BamA/TamA family outer membrane protein [Chthonomonadaceae bacterium]